MKTETAITDSSKLTTMPARVADPPTARRAEPTGLLTRVGALLERAEPGRALALVDESARADPAALNARGVCLLRLGRYDDAVRVYQGLLFPGGKLTIDDDTPVVYRANFAAAMLMLNEVTIAQAHLYPLRHSGHAGVEQLQRVLRYWKRGLSWWGRMRLVFAANPTFTPPAGFTHGWLA